MTFNFDFSADYILEDDHVLLRPLQLRDDVHLLRYSLNEPELWRYSLVPMAGKENLVKYIEDAVKPRNQGTQYAFIVFDKQTQQYAGSTRFYNINLPYKTLVLGYTWYGKQFHGTGLNKHCKYLLLQFAFERMGMERVEFHADNQNERSIAAMKSIGCTVEGVLRSNMPTATGGRRDSIILSILKSEWEANIKESLKQKLR